MLDDAEDKIRRNLLVYSFLVLAGCYLDIDFKSVISIPGVEFKTLDPGRVSILAVVIFLYLFMRFSHTKEYVRISEYFAKLWMIRASFVAPYLQNSFEDYKKNGRASVGGGVFDWSWFDHAIAGGPGVLSGENITVRLDYSKISLRGSEDHTIGIECFHRHHDAVAVLLGPSIPKFIPFRLPKRFELRRRAMALLSSLVADREFVVSILPVLVALAAYVYLVSRLFIVAFSPFWR